jgi:hypothetical protein
VQTLAQANAGSRRRRRHHHRTGTGRRRPFGDDARHDELRSGGG